MQKDNNKERVKELVAMFGKFQHAILYFKTAQGGTTNTKQMEKNLV